ncbi:MAG: aldehyde ferredoxin oxidoreductase family protein [Candidatus Hermodarchaeota archaeon]
MKIQKKACIVLYSYRGKILKIDLTNKNISNIPLNQEIVKDFLGGAGYACRYLYNKIEIETDPLSAENIIMIMTGPLNGTFAPNTGRWIVCSKSPYTGIWGESNCGSWFGAEVKKAGYDGIEIVGASDKPVYIEINDNVVKIKDAELLWGKNTFETTEKLKKIFGNEKAKVACIGLAGENLVKFANIISEQRAAGRTGMGAIFGSKKLKGIIAKGSNIELDVANKDKLKIAIKNARDYVKESFATQLLGEYGTAAALDMYNVTGELPLKYHTESKWDKARNISGVTMAETILIKQSFCHSCVIGCGRIIRIEEGIYQTDETKGPEYETICGFGSLILNDDLKSIAHLNKECNKYGIDTISTSGAIACLIYHYTKNNIKLNGLNGIDLNWGNINSVERLLSDTVNRIGVGNDLAEGSNYFAEKYSINREEIATVNNLEITYHDSRSNYGMSIAYGMSPRGPSHNACDAYYVLMGIPLEEIGIKQIDTYKDDLEMAECCSILMDYRALYSSMIMCSFCNPLPSQNAEIIKYATGLNFELEEIKSYGERIANMKRMFNIKMGLTPKDDKLPQIILRPFKKGGSAGRSPNFTKLKELFYEYRQWDSITGIPKKLNL